jgi:hypothetical protein
MGFLLLRAPGRAVLRFSNKSKQFSKAGQPGGRYSRLQSLLTICTNDIGEEPRRVTMNGTCRGRLAHSIIKTT